MKSAKFMKQLSDFTGDARLYQLSDFVDYDEGKTKYIIVSAVVAPYSGSETYIFPANKKGEVIDWGELDGSFRGGLDHEQALRNAGYEIAE